MSFDPVHTKFGTSSFIHTDVSAAPFRVQRLDIQDQPHLDAMYAFQSQPILFQKPDSRRPRCFSKNSELPAAMNTYRVYLDFAAQEIKKQVGHNAWSKLSQDEKSKLIHPLLIQRPSENEKYLFHKLQRILHSDGIDLNQPLSLNDLENVIMKLKYFLREKKENPILIQWLEELLQIQKCHHDCFVTSSGILEIIQKVMMVSKNRNYQKPLILQMPLGYFLQDIQSNISSATDIHKTIHEYLMFRLSHEAIYITTEIDSSETWILWRGMKFPYGQINFEDVEFLFQEIIDACDLWLSARDMIMPARGFDTGLFESVFIQKIESELRLLLWRKEAVWKKESNEIQRDHTDSRKIEYFLKQVPHEDRQAFLSIAARSDINLSTLERLANFAEKHPTQHFLSWLSMMLEQKLIDPELVIAISQSASNISWYKVQEALDLVRRGKRPDIIMLTNSSNHGETVSHLNDNEKSFVAGVRRKISGVVGEYCSVQKLVNEGWDGYPIRVIGREVPYLIHDNNQPTTKHSAIDLMIEIIGDDTLKNFQHDAKRILAYVKKIKTDTSLVHFTRKESMSKILAAASDLEESMLSFDFDSMMSAYLVLKYAIQQTLSNHEQHWDDQDHLYPAWLFEPETFDQHDSIFALVEVKNYSRATLREIIKGVKTNDESSRKEYETLKEQLQTHRQESTIAQFIEQGVLPFWTQDYHLTYILSISHEGFSERNDDEATRFCKHINTGDGIGYQVMTFEYPVQI